MDTTDPALVARARNGDVEAFGELFHGTQQRIYNFVQHMIARPEDAADLTQKVCCNPHFAAAETAVSHSWWSFCSRSTISGCFPARLVRSRTSSRRFTK